MNERMNEYRNEESTPYYLLFTCQEITPTTLQLWKAVKPISKRRSWGVEKRLWRKLVESEAVGVQILPLPLSSYLVLVNSLPLSEHLLSRL